MVTQDPSSVGLNDTMYAVPRLSVSKAVYKDTSSPTGYFMGNVSLFGNTSEQSVMMPRVSGGQAKTTLRHPNDSVITPGDHWLRNLQWIWGQHYAYTADPHANTADGGVNYELFAFEVEITSADGSPLQDVSIAAQGQQGPVIEVQGPVGSIVAALPASEPGVPWELTVGGHAVGSFATGFKPFQLGEPRYEPLVVDLSATVARKGGQSGQSSTVVARSVRRFGPPGGDQWKAVEVLDIKRKTASQVPPQANYTSPNATLTRHMGKGVDRSPLTCNAVQLPAGMSHGFYGPHESDNHTVRWQKALAFAHAMGPEGLGVDRVYLQIGDHADHDHGAFAFIYAGRALANQGLEMGVVPQPTFDVPFFGPSIGLYGSTLPAYRQQLRRLLQIYWSHFQGLPNTGRAGIHIGADNAGFVRYWNWAPAIPNRPVR